MTCPYCNGKADGAEYLQTEYGQGPQISPNSCLNCGAYEIGANDDRATPEEKAKGYYAPEREDWYNYIMGPNTLYMVGGVANGQRRPDTYSRVFVHIEQARNPKLFRVLNWRLPYDGHGVLQQVYVRKCRRIGDREYNYYGYNHTEIRYNNYV